MKHTILALMLAVTPLIDLFIYDARSCNLNEHLVGVHARLVREDLVIRFWYDDYDSENIELRTGKVYVVKETDKTTSVTVKRGEAVLTDGALCE